MSVSLYQFLSNIHTNPLIYLLSDRSFLIKQTHPSLLLLTIACEGLLDSVLI